MLRSTRRTDVPRPVNEDAAEEDWLTLREASEATGVPTSTIRKWARHENIPSFLEKTPDGHLRMVSMSGIERWTDEIGRQIEIAERPDVRSPDRTTTEIDLTEEEDRSDQPGAPEGSMMVPLDAWNRMLNQLGNLHEAGQQLAEARERAAKAETEAMFLRERLRELREEGEQRSEETGVGSATGKPVGQSTASLLRRMYRDWRRKSRG